MTEEKIKILNDLKLSLTLSLSDNLIDLVLFGSQLSGNSSDNSDYDILIVVKDKTDWKLERQISDICYEIDLRYNIITDTHILSENEFETPRGK
ncbi:MAG: nucleotidyltransferase domain-containing protein [Bacteroidales bacterium]|nr:nucleotidyltransferase domain-containing protein [Bacteroidales bacterium]